MFSLFAEVKFWTLKNDVQIRETDFGAFRFQDKKEIAKNDLYANGKENYASTRGNGTVLRNRHPGRLKNRLRDLEQTLATQRLISCEWRTEGYLRLITTTGLIVNVKTDLRTSALQAINYDRYLVGKISEVIDVACTRTHFIFAHAEKQVTLVYFVKPPAPAGSPEKLQKLEAKIQVVELAGAELAGRRLQRHVSANTAGDLALTWWPTSRHQVYPWAPNMKDRDRANVHVYTVTATHLDLVAYFRTESEPICVRFSKVKPYVLWALEQKISRKGDVTVESTCYNMIKRQLVKKSVTSIPLQTHVSCRSFSPDEDRMAFGCIDGSVVVLDEGRGVTRQVRAAFIPTQLRWHNDCALLVAANDRGQLQFFDMALSCVRAQLLSEDVTPSNLVDLGAYFTAQPTLARMKWSCKETTPYYGGKFVPNDNYLLLVFEGGPLAVLSLVGGGGLAGDLQFMGITPDSLVRMYITWHQIEKALSILLSLDWNKQGAQCLASLYHITNAIFRSPLTPEKEVQLETALGCFHSPLRPLTEAILDEFSDQVHDLTRRFFHHLVRYELFEKAFCLALDLNDRDLFLDLLNCARRLGDREMGQAVKEQLHALNSCGGSSCSCDESSEDEETGLPPLPNVVKRPPLPEISRFGKLRESAFFSRNQPSFSMIPEEPCEVPPDMPDSPSPSVIEKLYDLPTGTNISDRPRVVSATPSKARSSAMPPLSTTIPYIPSPHFTPIPLLAPSSSSLTAAPSLLTSPTPPALTPSSPASFAFSSTSRKNSAPPSLATSPAPVIPAPTFTPSFAFSSTSRKNSTPSLATSPTLSAPAPPFTPSSTASFAISSSSRKNSSVPLAPSLATSPTLSPTASAFAPSTSSTPPASFAFSSTFRSHSTGPIYPANPLSSHLYGAASKAAEQKSSAAPAKQKVKFSDTVTQIVVADISELSGNKQRRVKGVDPKRELADSLPLCLGNKDYLKDFAKAQDEDEDLHGGATTTIKVIHFGVV